MRGDDIQESKCNLATTLTENTETGLWVLLQYEKSLFSSNNFLSLMV